MSTVIVILIVVIVATVLIIFVRSLIFAAKAELQDLTGGAVNNLYVYSNPAINALDVQFKSDRKHYSKQFSDFINKAESDEEVRKLALTFDAHSGQDGWGTLIDANNAEENVAALVQNATIFAIAVTCTYYIKGTKISKGVANTMIYGSEYPYRPTMSWSNYAKYMEKNQPHATAIALSLTAILGRQNSSNVIAVMGYLIEQGDLNKKSE